MDNSDVLSLESILGHRFEHKTLLARAITHPGGMKPSADHIDQVCQPYRPGSLAGLGADLLTHVLRIYLVLCLFKCSMETLHDICSACTASGTLEFVFMCKATSVANEHNVDQANRQIWDLMRFNTERADSLPLLQNYHDVAHDHIHSALWTGQSFPWIDLLAYSVPGVLAAALKSCLAALWLDTSASLNEAFWDVEKTLKKFDFFSLMRRLANDDVTCGTPQRVVEIRSRRLAEITNQHPQGKPHSPDQRTDKVLRVAGVELARVREQPRSGEDRLLGPLTELSITVSSFAQSCRWD